MTCIGAVRNASGLPAIGAFSSHFSPVSFVEISITVRASPRLTSSALAIAFVRYVGELHLRRRKISEFRAGKRGGAVNPAAKKDPDWVGPVGVNIVGRPSSQ